MKVFKLSDSLLAGRTARLPELLPDPGQQLTGNQEFRSPGVPAPYFPTCFCTFWEKSKWSRKRERKKEETQNALNCPKVLLSSINKNRGCLQNEMRQSSNQRIYVILPQAASSMNSNTSLILLNTVTHHRLVKKGIFNTNNQKHENSGPNYFSSI
jgi:hypothetical protein